MTGHIEQIRQRYDQFSRGDIRGATQDWADDIVWEGGNSAELPMGGTRHGKGWRWRGDGISRFQLVTDTLQLAQLLGLAAHAKGTAPSATRLPRSACSQCPRRSATAWHLMSMAQRRCTGTSAASRPASRSTSWR